MSLNLSRTAVGAILMVIAGSTFATEANYRCSSGTQLRAVFSAPSDTLGSVTLFIDGNDVPVVLPQTRSADGGRYEHNGMLFWIKGNQATLTRHGVSETCLTP